MRAIVHTAWDPELFLERTNQQLLNVARQLFRTCVSMFFRDLSFAVYDRWSSLTNLCCTLVWVDYDLPLVGVCWEQPFHDSQRGIGSLKRPGQEMQDTKQNKLENVWCKTSQHRDQCKSSGNTGMRQSRHSEHEPCMRDKHQN